ncbi:MAG: hypothetical protein U5K69_27145 [Balneolaceae bacterium]|nr:hypothetical protein [Balneolaceae bacterium]
MAKTENRERFEKVAGKRVQFILEKLDLLGNCANQSNYDYSEEDVKKCSVQLEKK